MTDEPMAERLTDEELDDARVGRTLNPSYDDARWLATIDALLSQLREQRDRADEYERFFRASDANLGTTQAAYAHEVLRADAAERTVREQREALESIVKFSTDPLAAATARATLASLPPVGDERTEP